MIDIVFNLRYFVFMKTFLFSLLAVLVFSNMIMTMPQAFGEGQAAGGQNGTGTVLPTDPTVSESENEKNREKDFAFRITLGIDFMPESVYGAPQGRRRSYFNANGITSFSGVDGNFYGFGLGVDATFMKYLFLAGGVEYAFMSDSETKRTQSTVTNLLNQALFFGAPLLSDFDINHKLKLSMFRFTPRVGINFRVGRGYILRPFLGFAFGPSWYTETISYSGINADQDTTIKLSSNAWFYDKIVGSEFVLGESVLISGAFGMRTMPFGRLSEEIRTKHSAIYPNVQDKGDIYGHFWEIRIGARI